MGLEIQDRRQGKVDHSARSRRPAWLKPVMAETRDESSLPVTIEPMAERQADAQGRPCRVRELLRSCDSRKWWENWKPARSEQHGGQVMRRFEADIFPKLGRRPVSAVEAPELVMMVKAIAARGAGDLAVRALQTTNQALGTPSPTALPLGIRPPTSAPRTCFHPARSQPSPHQWRRVARVAAQGGRL
jgi:hypothetical protein